MVEVCGAVPGDFLVLSGDDALTLPLMAVGGRGLISVAGNEVPGEMARNHPGQIRAIYIRDVTGEATNSARYEKSFANVPGSRWRIFKEPSEIGGLPPGEQIR
jgi:hypothetical protein